MPNYKFGNIQGVDEGDTFKDRQALREAGVHLAPVAGIDGNGNVGATSIVLNGGYVDDLDLGDEIIYTGHGGNKGGKQIKDQSWNSYGNKALIVSELHGLPVRVTRGYKHNSKFSPDKEYQYGGLYYVESHFEEKGKDGFLVCRYRLVKEDPMKIKPKNEIFEFSEGTQKPNRQETTTLRIIRDTRLSRQIKELYDYTCQICGIQISVGDIKYAEAAHIRPLGKPHNGVDKASNILCLCPNHHVMLDKGIISIKDNFQLIGGDLNLSVNENHEIDFSNLNYHQNKIYKKW